MTTREEIGQWFDEGVAKGSAYMVIVCDTFDWGDYPVYCSTEQVARQRTLSPGEMQRVMEVYDLSADKVEQLNKRRNWALSETRNG